MRATCLILAAAPALLGGCGAGGGDRSIDAVIDADFATGEVVVTCRGSSSDKCHGLFVTNGVEDKGEIAVGSTGSVAGLGPDTYYCIDAQPPVLSECRPKLLVAGQQIVRKTAIPRD